MEQNRNSHDKSMAKVWTIPNLLSVLRICLIPVIVWLYCGKRDYILAAGVLILSGATDILDGFIARKFHMTSDLGRVLDPVADKLTQGAMLFCLLTRFLWVIFPIALMAAKEIFMSITGAVVIKRTGVVLGAEWHGKAATCLLYAMILLHMCWCDIPFAASALAVAACTLMIAVSFAIYGVRNLNALKGKIRGTSNANE